MAVMVFGLMMTSAIGDEPPADKESRRREIEQMNEVDRNRLQRNFELFQELTPTERDKVRQIHTTVEQDESLKAVMEAYYDWLSTLSPVQREQLRRETDPAARVELIRQFKDEQASTGDEYEAGGGPSGRFSRGRFRPPMFGSGRGKINREMFDLELNDSELEAVTDVVANKIQRRIEEVLQQLPNVQQLNEQQQTSQSRRPQESGSYRPNIRQRIQQFQESIASQQGIYRYVSVIGLWANLASFANRGSGRGMGRGPGRGPGRGQTREDHNQVFAEMIEAIDGTEVGNKLQELPDDEIRRIAFAEILSHSLWQSYFKERDKIWPDEETRRKFFEQLSANDRERLLSGRQEWFERSVGWEFVRQNHPEVSELFENLKDASSEMKYLAYGGQGSRFQLPPDRGRGGSQRGRGEPGRSKSGRSDSGRNDSGMGGRPSMRPRSDGGR